MEKGEEVRVEGSANTKMAWERVRNALMEDLIGVVLSAALAVFGVTHLGINDDSNILVWLLAILCLISGVEGMLLYTAKEVWHAVLWYRVKASKKVYSTVTTVDLTKGMLTYTVGNKARTAKIQEFTWGETNRWFDEELEYTEENPGNKVKLGVAEVGSRVLILDMQPVQG